ncbi:MAG: sigma-70 family RNA polymerase sigma factor, partial [Acidobacteriales bacterium]|nr:sigma-70 family RNA polymerase sigma factor [Terriglobales bacterium]
MRVSNSDECDLLAKAKAGCAEAFAEALEPHLPMLYAYSRVLCGNHNTAEDVVQETALVAYRRLNCLFPEVDFAAWLRAIARRLALAARRQDAKLTPLIEEAMEAAYNDPAPDTIAAEREALTECLKTLDGRTEQIVRGHYFQGSLLAELAAVLNLKLNTVKSILHRARQALRECLRRRLGWEVG